MTRIVTNLSDAYNLLNDYLIEERPLNLVEMQSLKEIIACVNFQATEVCKWINRDKPKMGGLTQVHFANLKSNLGGSAKGLW